MACKREAIASAIKQIAGEISFAEWDFLLRRVIFKISSL
jgi:hypothetical protein